MGRILENIGYTYKDVTIVPSVITSIRHRKDCDPYVRVNDLDASKFFFDERDYLPIFTAKSSLVTQVAPFATISKVQGMHILVIQEPVIKRLVLLKILSGRTGIGIHRAGVALENALITGLDTGDLRERVRVIRLHLPVLVANIILLRLIYRSF